jgi:hypothetical protein
LDSRALEKHILDLSKRNWSHSRFGLTAIGTWVRLDDRWRPCMAIVRNNAHTLRPCVIPLEDAWRWSDQEQKPELLAARFLGQLGIDPSNPDNRHRLIDLVNSRMVDLITMPPRPADAEEHDEPVVELTVVNSLTGKTEVEL